MAVMPTELREVPALDSSVLCERFRGGSESVSEAGAGGVRKRFLRRFFGGFSAAKTLTSNIEIRLLASRDSPGGRGRRNGRKIAVRTPKSEIADFSGKNPCLTEHKKHYRTFPGG
jgi:hypothetical protein